MYTVDLYLRVRLACHVDGLSQREAASRFGIARETVRKMLRHSEPPGYRRRQPPKRPKLAPFTDIIDRILEEDRPVHRKQHHTAKRIFERLRDEHGFTGKETIVKDYVRERRLRRREMFVPLSHPPGHAQADFGEADAIIAGVKYRAHFFVMTLPHSDACFVAAYPAATTEAWLDGHNRAFVFFGGVPQSILYDNDKCLVSRILPDGTRQRTRAFSGLQSHYLFEDRYGRPGKGNDKGNVEGVVGYARRNFMTPLPRFASWDAFNGQEPGRAMPQPPQAQRPGALPANDIPRRRRVPSKFVGQASLVDDAMLNGFNGTVGLSLSQVFGEHFGGWALAIGLERRKVF